MADTRTALRIAAEPDPLTLDLERSAVLVIDMQNDFGSPGGMFDRAGIDIAPIRATIAPTARVLAAAREAGLPVVYIRMEHREDLSDAGPDGSPHRRKHAPFRIGSNVAAPDGRASRVLVRDTWNTAVVDALAPLPGDIVVSKHRYSAFFQTDLDMVLRSLGVSSLVVTGCTTSVCVEATVRDAMYRDYACLVLTDCTAEPIAFDAPRSNHEASLLTIRLLLGWTAPSELLLSALSSLRRPAEAGAAG
jgi:ureidoacrylate peracid hydrolase